MLEVVWKDVDVLSCSNKLFIGDALVHEMAVLASCHHQLHLPLDRQDGKSGLAISCWKFLTIECRWVLFTDFKFLAATHLCKEDLGIHAPVEHQSQ